MAWPRAFLPIARWISGPARWLARRFGGFSEIEHVGRRSGRVFHTPVRAVRRGEVVVVGASFGTGADWIRNVRAAGHCRMRVRGRTLDLTDPQVVRLGEVRHLLPPVTSFILRRLARTDECVVLQVA